MRILIQSRKQYTEYDDAYSAGETVFFRTKEANEFDVTDNPDGTFGWVVGIVRD